MLLIDRDRDAITAEMRQAKARHADRQGSIGWFPLCSSIRSAGASLSVGRRGSAMILSDRIRLWRWLAATKPVKSSSGTTTRTGQLRPVPSSIVADVM
jgi:hypothetical protein